MFAPTRKPQLTPVNNPNKLMVYKESFLWLVLGALSGVNLPRKSRTTSTCYVSWLVLYQVDAARVIGEAADSAEKMPP